MTPKPDARDRHWIAFELYCHGRTLDAQQREEYLSQKCGDDAALMSEVHRRLASEQHHQTVQRAHDD